MAETRWGDIYDHLKLKGFAVYSPGQKTGECTSPYIVIKDNGLMGMSDISSSKHTFDLMCYIPLKYYSRVEAYVDSVETAMDELFPTLRPVHYRTPSYLDEQVKAHMVSTQYINYVKNKRR